MRIAFIPPKGLEHALESTSLQMMLAHVDYPEYRRAYALAKARGNYIILDNGAAELERGQSPFTEHQLVGIAERVGAKELILPDALYNTKKTLNLVSWAVLQLERTILSEYKKTLAFMAVVQGHTMTDIRQSVHAYTRHDLVTVLGLPRLLMSDKHRAIRIDAANWIESEYPGRFKIHLLGTNPIWVQEVRAATRYAPHIRSVDTSMPFNYTLEGARLDAKLPPVIKRADRYFEEHRGYDANLLRQNLDTMLRWTSAEARTGQL